MDSPTVIDIETRKLVRADLAVAEARTVVAFDEAKKLEEPVKPDIEVQKYAPLSRRRRQHAKHFSIITKRLSDTPVEYRAHFKSAGKKLKAEALLMEGISASDPKMRAFINMVPVYPGR